MTPKIPNLHELLGLPQISMAGGTLASFLATPRTVNLNRAQSPADQEPLVWAVCGSVLVLVHHRDATPVSPDSLALGLHDHEKIEWSGRRAAVGWAIFFFFGRELGAVRD